VASAPAVNLGPDWIVRSSTASPELGLASLQSGPPAISHLHAHTLECDLLLLRGTMGSQKNLDDLPAACEHGDEEIFISWGSFSSKQSLVHISIR
jgi:hypothetical protein